MTIITTGPGSPNDSAVARQDLRDVIQDQPLFNLYLLALQRFQQVDQQDLHSWYLIAGIHGRPYIAYDGVQGDQTFGGYCTHSSILFPTWHRPYLALYEQTLAKFVVDIANQFTGPEKQNYVNAARRFRIPYWDWASDSTLPDVVASQENIQVTTPQGDQTIPNPLFCYTFHPPNNLGGGSPWETWQTTLRWPDTDGQDATSQPDVLEGQLQNNRLTIRDRTYNLLTQANTYQAFSNDGFAGPQSDPKWYDSLESIHNQIHGLTGGNGHMGDVGYAAFDPVFYLHHVNVDRMFAIWQALNPNSYVIPRPSEAGTFTTEPGTIENVNSPLEPFWQSQKKFWTSATARHTNTFFYTYPELAQLTNLPPKQQIPNLRAQINSLYGSSAPVASILPIGITLAAAAPAAQKVLPEPVKAAPAVKPPPSGPTSAELPIEIAPGSEHHGKDSFYEWITNIKVEKYAVKSTFFVQIFLGDPPSDPKKWGEDLNLVGTHVVFATDAHHTKCARCIAASEEHKLVTGMIPLTGALGDKLGQDKLMHLEPDLVVPYLKKHLHWRIQKHDRSPVKLEEIPSLSVSVGHMLVKVPKHDTEFPVWGEMNIVAGATAGKPGGTSHPH